MKLFQNKFFKIILAIIVLLVASARICNSCVNSARKNATAKNTTFIGNATVEKNTVIAQTSSKLSIANDNIFKSVVDSLIQRGVDTAFINKYVVDKNVEFNENFVKINVTGYLKKVDYSYATSDIAVKKSKSFLKENSKVLLAAEKKYNVPKEIIVSILWIETRLGDYLGKNHLPSVFFSTALVNEEQFIELNNKVVDETDNNDSTKSALKNRVKQRSNSKAKWAINELVAMNEIEKKFGIDFNKVNGSWAGAFGISQFLPSSFLNFAVDGNDDGKIDLFNRNDAIYSVANYLATHKWGKTNEQKRKAIWSYNNSNAYVDAVLKLSKLIK